MKRTPLFIIILLLSLGAPLSMGMRWIPQEIQGTLDIAADADLRFEEVARFDVPNANQGIGVDDLYFYAVNNTVITKHEKATGIEVARWDPQDNPLIHLDSAAVIDGLLYCAHSNYSEWPMTSSIEVWDTETMEHIGTHSFGIRWGSCTWIDYHDGYWWATFANYNKMKNRPDPENPNGYDVTPGSGQERISIKAPYGYKRNTTMVQFSADWKPIEAFVMPDGILATEKTGDMSNSGGSWGPDGYLYLSGHDLPEVFKVKLPEAGSILEVIETIPLVNVENPQTIDDLSIRGQGIAWDRSGAGNYLYGIIRATDAEEAQGITNKVTVSELHWQ